jgi:hypothetical protein
MAEGRKTSGIVPSSLVIMGLALILIGERVVGTGSWRGTVSGLGSLIILAAVVIRGAAFLAAQGNRREAEADLLLAYGGVALAIVCYVLSTDPALAIWGIKDESATKLNAVLSVIWGALLTVSLSALLFMELVYARMPIAPSVEVKRVRNAAKQGVTLAFSIIFVLSANYVASERDVRRDMSYFKTTRPSSATLDLVRRLDHPLEIILFYRRSDDVLEQVKPYFDELAAASKSVTVKVVDVAWVPELAREQRIQENGVVLLSWEKARDKKGESIEIGTELTGARAKLRKLDGLFQQKFRRLTQPSRSLYLTVGHGERNNRDQDGKREEGTRDLEQILKRLNIKTEKLGVADGLGNTVPEKASAVTIIGPRDRFLPEENAALLAYVQKGGRLLLMVDPDAEVGLAPLLDGLGLALLPGVLSSEKHYLRHDYAPSDRILVYSNRYSAHPAVSSASRHRTEVATVFAGGGGLEKAQSSSQRTGASPKVSFPLRSAEDFWRDLNGNFHREPSEPTQSLNMIAAVTIKGDKTPEGRAVIIADGDFVSDKLMGNAGNALVFVDALAWLIADEQISGEVASEEDIPIEHTRDRDKVWFYATSFAAPLPIVGLGMWVTRRRRRRSEAAA